MCHEWVKAILPDVPPHVIDEAGEEKCYYKNAFTGACTLCEYRKNEVHCYQIILYYKLDLFYSLDSKSNTTIWNNLFTELFIFKESLRQKSHTLKIISFYYFIFIIFYLFMHLWYNQLVFESESASTIAIAKESITRMANYSRVQLEEVLTTSNQSVPSFLSLVSWWEMLGRQI